MMLPRKMSLQLTPLFDMLLIVIFAQYLEVRETQVNVTQRAHTAMSDLAETQKRLQALRTEEESLRVQMEIERGSREAAESQLSTEQEKLSQSQSDLDRALEQQRVVGELVSELFQIPSNDFDKLLKATRMPSLEQSPQQMARVKEKLRQLSLQRGGRMIEHLLSYEEIRKRCDVWEMHLDAKGVITLNTGQRSTRIRLPMTADDDVDIDQFVTELYAWYRSLPQPKSLVVILLTYDRASRISMTEAVRKTLPRLVSRMQSDHLGQIRFEYADLGFRLE